ncbi:MAG TPA: glutathione S-transferase family protein [Thermoleophilaceae bacterium]|nr:glutathione S-transferase family protein [Thermoleophilaceae bacterium]
MQLYRAEYSTNVERAALALAHKGLSAEPVWIDYADRTAVEEVSGQPLVPVLVDDDGTVVADSVAIMRHLDERHPQDPLFGPPEVDLFVEWFDEVWKVPPNAIEASSDGDLVSRLSERMAGWLDLFERLLAERDFLVARELTAADLVAYPFLKYAAGREPADDELFHRILDENQTVEGRPRLADWIARMGSLPQC